MKPLLTGLICALFCLPTLAGAQAFPVEIEHRYGTAHIPERPQKIVSLSFIGHDFLLALGVVPHALRRWYGTDPYGVWVWGHDALGDAQPIVMQGQIDIEKIAQMKPDLIIGQWSGMTGHDYALLSQIAPTIAPRAEHGDYGTPWQDMLRTAGLATGHAQKAQDIITRLEGRFARISADHPDWAGKTAVMVWIGQTGAYTNRDIRGRFLEDLSLRVPQAVNDRGTDKNFYTLIPAEDLSPIDADALIWIDAGGALPGLARKPLRRTMRAYREGREIYADPLLSAALSHSSPLSLDYALDRLEPLLDAALDGDPFTVVTSSRDAGILAVSP